MGKTSARSDKKAAANQKKNQLPWQQILFAGFALLIVVSMILSAFM